MTELNHEKNRRILVIDDNRAIHDDFRKILAPDTRATAALDAAGTKLFGETGAVVRKIQYEMGSAYQGQEGVTLLKAALEAGRPYAIAFVDIRMPPGWDGVETTKRIWALDPEVQIVLCTAYADYSWDDIMEKIGNCDGLLILKKPFDTVEALQMAHALTEKWWLHRQSRRKMEELESLVAERTRELRQTNHTLRAEVEEHRRAKAELEWKTAFLEAQVNSSIDGILVVDAAGKKTLQNQRMNDLFKIPRSIAEDKADEPQLEWVTSMTRNSGQFFEKVVYLNAHPEEISRDEIELKDGTTLDRYSSPVTGKDGIYYGRIWTFRDITDRKRADEAVTRLAAIVEHSNEAIISKTLEGIITSWNPAAERMFGYTAAEIVGQPLEILIPPDHPTEESGILERFAKGEVIRQFETIRIRKDGQRLDVSVTFSPVKDSYGKMVGISKIIRDITRRKLAENALRASNEKFQQLVDNITDVFWIRSPDMREVRYLSPGFEGIWGRSVASLCANPQAWADYVLPEDRERVWSAFATLTGNTASLEIEYRIVRPDGEIRWVRVRGFQVRDKAGTLLSLTGIITDITERKRVETALRESEERLSSLIENARDAIFTIAADGTFTSLNPAVAAISGITRAEWIGNPVGGIGDVELIRTAELAFGHPGRAIHAAIVARTAFIMHQAVVIGLVKRKI